MPRKPVLRVKNISDYIYRKDRLSPWIMLHERLLKDVRFTALDDASKYHLLSIICQEAKTGLYLACDPHVVNRLFPHSDPVDIVQLLESGFVELYQGTKQDVAQSWRSASSALAQSRRDVSAIAAQLDKDVGAIAAQTGISEDDPLDEKRGNAGVRISKLDARMENVDGSPSSLSPASPLSPLSSRHPPIPPIIPPSPSIPQIPSSPRDDGKIIDAHIFYDEAQGRHYRLIDDADGFPQIVWLDNATGPEYVPSPSDTTERPDHVHNDLFSSAFVDGSDNPSEPTVNRLEAGPDPLAELFGDGDNPIPEAGEHPGQPDHGTGQAGPEAGPPNREAGLPEILGDALHGQAGPDTLTGSPSRWSASWTVPESWIEWALAEKCPDPWTEAERFVDYWGSKKSRAEKLNWQATWRNWVRQSMAYRAK